MDDEEDDEYWDEEEELPLLHGDVHIISEEPMQEQEQHAEGFYVQGRTVFLFEGGVLRFQSNDPVLVRHIKALLNYVSEVRHQTIQEMADKAQEDLFQSQGIGFADPKAQEAAHYHAEQLEKRLIELEHEEDRGA